MSHILLFIYTIKKGRTYAARPPCFLLSHVGGHRVPAAPPPDPSGKPLAEQGGNLLAWLHALLLPTRRRTSRPPLQQAGVDTPPAFAASPPAETQAPAPEPPHKGPDLQTRLARQGPLVSRPRPEIRQAPRRAPRPRFWRRVVAGVCPCVA